MEASIYVRVRRLELDNTAKQLMFGTVFYAVGLACVTGHLYIEGFKVS